jgi:hypothetical protein
MSHIHHDSNPVQDMRHVAEVLRERTRGLSNNAVVALLRI